mgnify:CR=1 FL=1
MAERITFEPESEEAVLLLEAYIQSGNLNFLIGSGASLPAISLAGNIESQLNDLLEAESIVEANLRALNFIEGLEDKNSRLSLGLEDAESGDTLGRYVQFLGTIDQLLFERKNILLPRQANIFTTNYDLFFEHAAAQVPSTILNDGFDRSSPTGTQFPFSPERYFDRTYRSGGVYNRQAEITTVNLMKLHGSLNWRKTSNSICFRSNEPEPLSEEQKRENAHVERALNNRALILPNLKKFGSTLLDRVYYDLLRIFSNSMDRDNALLIAFGFSFADEHILDITRRALRNPTSQLVIFAYNGEAAESFEEKFTKHRNVKVVSPREGENIDFAAFNSLLNRVVPSRAAFDD